MFSRELIQTVETDLGAERLGPSLTHRGKPEGSLSRASGWGGVCTAAVHSINVSSAHHGTAWVCA